MVQQLDELASAAAGPSLLCDVNGRIAHIFFALPAYEDSFTTPLLACFHGIREALGSDVRCTVLHHPAHADAVEEALGAQGALDTISWEEGFVLRLRDVSAKLEGGTLRITKMAHPDFTSWVQDGFFVAKDKGAPRVWASPRVKRLYGGWDDALPRRLATHLGWPCEVLPFAVEAGNVLVDDEAAVIGSDVPTALTDDQWRDFRDRVERSGRIVIVTPPGGSQPVFHLDLFVTLAGVHPNTGQPQALVGSVRLARVLLGEAQRAADADAEESLDAVAAHMVDLGYTVERLPLLPFTSPYLPAQAWYSYNNCLVEIWRGSHGELRRRVILPTYDTDGEAMLEVLDAHAAGVWERLGFEIRFARGAFARLAQLGGSLRCMTKVLERIDA